MKKQFKNLSLASFGSQIYSDYGYEKGYVGGDYLREFKKTNKLLKGKKINVMYDSAKKSLKLRLLLNIPGMLSRFTSMTRSLSVLFNFCALLTFIAKSSMQRVAVFINEIIMILVSYHSFLLFQ